ncbi:GL13914 [Drosophila persimilis]|uniref:Pre-mRNA-splicing factor 18 n=2 Tax=pseudoobscura subgroup TaxID=32358 RepID=A0A6I8UMI5_DROPS|nr:pre-mRNA-splicing factor 18 [Drosophila pseudoobscura]XP_002020309.1 pre-mRNA-splicing factor 18 [Drosophila persimilis]XP_033245432.1 pre-mRNA-splicing factor 18 [Drosophila miranda]EDW39121.1 GL13914 [Drosophila persimilis]
MDLLKKEIARKRKLLEDKQLIDDKKKYFKRGDLNAKNTEEVLQKVGYKKQESVEAQGQTTEGAYSFVADGQNILPRTEVIRRLRERGEPILIFGETEPEAFDRLRQCEISQPEANRGFRNDFQEAMEQVDAAYLQEMFANAPTAKEDKKSDLAELDESVSWESIQTMAQKMGRNKDYDMDVIITLLTFLLKLWNDQIATYSKHEIMSTKVKMTRVIYTQTKEYVKPLFRKLKHHTLPEDILDSLRDIVKHLLNRNYITASDAYLEMAIGNAPWPIGVTMVGIHARTGREKIFSKNVAHVMNDETQRKYIQGLKRLMTKCQEYFPTDPSKCVEYVSKKDRE